MLLKDPEFAIDANTKAILDAAVRADVLRTISPMKRGERKRLSEQLAIEATLALFDPVRATFEVTDANDLRRNTPGYDLLVDGRIRLQVKGGTYVESVGWTQNAAPGSPDMNYDFLVLVDLGAMLNSHVGRLEKYSIPIKRTADFYIIPAGVVQTWVESPRYVNGKGVQLYIYKRPLTAGTKEQEGQTLEISQYLKRFDLLEAALIGESRRSAET